MWYIFFKRVQFTNVSFNSLGVVCTYIESGRVDWRKQNQIPGSGEMMLRTLALKSKKKKSINCPR